MNLRRTVLLVAVLLALAVLANLALAASGQPEPAGDPWQSLVDPSGPYLPLILARHDASETPTPTPTATPEEWPTPYVAEQVDLPDGSHPHGVAYSADGLSAYVAFHGVDHDGRTLGIFDDALALTAEVALATTATGPNGVAVLPASGLVVVANRQTENAAVVDPDTETLVQEISAKLLPDGVIVQDELGYIANYGNDTVTVFDPETLMVVRNLAGVGHEPALFAANPVTGQVYLSAHGSNQVFVLRDGLVAGQWNAIPEPYGLSYDPASRRLYIANRGYHHTVTVLDTNLGQVVGAIDVGKEPYVLQVNPRTGHLFVACGNEVKVYDTLDWSLVTSIAVPPGAEEGIALHPAGGQVLVASRDSDALTVIQDQGPPRVLFVSDRDGNGEVYRMLPDGSQQQRLTFTLGADENAPAGSPDGRWIAYERREAGQSSYSHLWLMSRDGRGATRLTDGPSDNLAPTWSADSRKIAFASDRDGDWDIYLLDLASGKLTQVTDDDAEDLNPAWAHGDDRIAFQSNRLGPNPEIFTMAPDGSDVQRLTVNPNGDGDPSWSPAADRIVFWGSRPEGQGLYVVDAGGTDSSLLVAQSLRPGSPAWAYAGEIIAFSGYRPESGYSEIMRVQADGSGLVLLTNNEVDFDYAPGWLPGMLGQE